MTPVHPEPRRAARALLSVALSFAVVFGTPAWAMGPLEKNHPLVEAGNDAYREERYEDALAAYQSAKQQLGDNPALDFNIGNALHKLGRHDEAREAWLRATKSPDKELQEKAWYNLGNGYAAQKKRKEALSAYRRALTLDPTDDMARHNLELLLRDVPPKQGGNDGGTDGGQDGGQDAGKPQPKDAGLPQDGGTDGGRDGGSDGGADGGSADGGAQDGGHDGGMDGGAGDGGAGDGGSSDGGQDGGQNPQPGDGGADGGTDGGQGEEQQQGGQDAGQDGGVDGGMAEEEREATDAGVPQDLSQQDAEKLLDSMQQNEKNLQLWRFQQRKKPRGPNEKDW